MLWSSEDVGLIPVRECWSLASEVDWRALEADFKCVGRSGSSTETSAQRLPACDLDRQTSSWVLKCCTQRKISEPAGNKTLLPDPIAEGGGDLLPGWILLRRRRFYLMSKQQKNRVWERRTERLREWRAVQRVTGWGAEGLHSHIQI